MMIREIGGYLPLELENKGEFFRNISEKNILRVNTGRTAIWYAIKKLCVRKIYIPFFYCPDVLEMIRTFNIEICFYHITKEFLPENVICKEDEAILLVNYYGMLGNKISKLLSSFSNIILDQAHAFYEPPVFRKGIYNVYSCRKFFGVSDGAYLIGMDLESEKEYLQRDLSYKRTEHLIKSIECGTNEAYIANKKNEDEIGKKHLGMSVFTEKVLKNINYTAVAQKRKDNFQFLDDRLRSVQLLEIPDDSSICYVYPLRLEISLHKQLVERKIYIPMLWKEMLDTQNEKSWEYIYANTVLPLPIDQRYGRVEMEYMAAIIEKILINKSV